MSDSVPISNKKKYCVYCGDAQVNHIEQYINSSIDVLLSTSLPRQTKPSSHFMQIEHSPTVRIVSEWIVGILSSIGILRYSDDLTKTITTRTKCVWLEAQKRGIKMQQTIFFGKAIEDSRALVPLTKGAAKQQWNYFQSIPIPPWVETFIDTWVDDKKTFKKIFKKNGLTVADGYSVRTTEEALQVFEKIGGAVIVKPREGSRARHTTVNITDKKELVEAFKRAQQLCPFVMVEKFISGTLYRATCVNGKLIGVVEFIKPSIVADGTMTVSELLKYHNEHKKYPTLTDVKDDAWFRDAIQHQGYTTQSRPQAGSVLLLSEHSERSNGGYFIDITDEIPDESRKEIECAARVSQVIVIGFDIVSQDLRDISKSFTFIEGNSLPYIELHDIPYEGKPRNVAAAVWDLWFEKVNT